MIPSLFHFPGDNPEFILETLREVTGRRKTYVVSYLGYVTIALCQQGFGSVQAA